jgi:hypothetical protein
LQSLIRGLLCKSDAELAPWRDALVEALGRANREAVMDDSPAAATISFALSNIVPGQAFCRRPHHSIVF